jgi:hypothetical protein
MKRKGTEDPKLIKTKLSEKPSNWRVFFFYPAKSFSTAHRTKPAVFFAPALWIRLAR